MILDTSISFLIILIQILYVSGARIKDKMYVPINGAACFRRLNGTHQTGCSSAFNGNVGVLHLVENNEDINFFVNAPPSPPYAAMIPPHLFTRENMLRLKNDAGRNVSVVLLINKTNKMEHFSQELNCPNPYSGISSIFNNTDVETCDANSPENSWNPWGTGLLHEDFPFPIFYISDNNEIDTLISCFNKFNNFNYESHGQRSLCAVEVSTFMSAAVSTEVCMRRTNFINNLGPTKYCDPLEGLNIYATLFPRFLNKSSNENEPLPVNTTEKFILISCRLDTASMFEDLGLGAMDSLLGYATLVGIAQMLHQLLPNESLLENKTRNVLFMIFNGESYDYIGSQRLIFDMENLAFPASSSGTGPIPLENIEYMLDIGVLDEIDIIQLHTFKEFPKADDILKKLQKYSQNMAYDFNINFDQIIGPNMPPTSAQSFLRKNLSFPALVLNSVPTNRFYHSIYDNVKNVDFTYANTSLNYTTLMRLPEAFRYFRADSVQMKIRNISTVISMALYEDLTGTIYKDDYIVNPLLIDEFLYCFLESADCKLFKAASKPNSFPEIPLLPPRRYISVKDGPQESSGWSYRLLAYLLSSPTNNYTIDNCTEKPLFWFAGYDGTGECRYTTQYYSHALSPAFLIEDYDWTSRNYSTWTESTWNQFSARIFLRPSRTHEAVTLSIGFIVLIISFCLVYIVNSRADILFEDAPTSTVMLSEPTAC